jgi:hypothetical protein
VRLDGHGMKFMVIQQLRSMEAKAFDMAPQPFRRDGQFRQSATNARAATPRASMLMRVEESGRATANYRSVGKRIVLKFSTVDSNPVSRRFLDSKIKSSRTSSRLRFQNSRNAFSKTCW